MGQVEQIQSTTAKGRTDTLRARRRRVSARPADETKLTLCAESAYSPNKLLRYDHSKLHMQQISRQFACREVHFQFITSYAIKDTNFRAMVIKLIEQYKRMERGDTIRLA